LSFLLDRVLPTSHLGSERDYSSAVKSLISAMAGSNHLPDAQALVITEVSYFPCVIVVFYSILYLLCVNLDFLYRLKPLFNEQWHYRSVLSNILDYKPCLYLYAL